MLSGHQAPHLHPTESHTLYWRLNFRGSEEIQISGVQLSDSMTLGVKALSGTRTTSLAQFSAPADSPLNCLPDPE